MAGKPVDKLRKLDAVIADPAATDGEKAAAAAAAQRVRASAKRKHAEDTEKAIRENDTMYVLGHALGRARRGEVSGNKGVLFALGRAVRKATKKD